MAVGETPILDTLADLTAVSIARSELEPQSLLLVRLAALIATDAPASSYLMHLGPAAEVGITLDVVQDVLVTVAPIVGTSRTLAAAGRIVEAFDLAIDLILDADDDTL